MNAVNTTSVADIALVGLGEVGGRFLDEMLRLADRGIRVVYVAELDDTPGRQRALAAGIPLVPLEEIVKKAHVVDVIFDLTGNPAIRRSLREKMRESGNLHTIIAPETMARMLWSVVTDEYLPTHDAERGY